MASAKSCVELPAETLGVRAHVLPAALRILAEATLAIDVTALD